MNDITDLGNLMARTLTFMTATLESTPNGAPGMSYIYHSAQSPPSWCCDYLAVWMERLFSYSTFPNEAVASVDNCPLGLAATVSVKLMRPCWPMPTANTPIDPDATTQAAMGLSVDGVVMRCAIANDLAAGRDSLILGPLGMDQPPVVVLATVPTATTRGCAGWVSRFTIGLDECCVM